MQRFDILRLFVSAGRFLGWWYPVTLFCLVGLAAFYAPDLWTVFLVFLIPAVLFVSAGLFLHIAKSVMPWIPVVRTKKPESFCTAITVFGMLFCSSVYVRLFQLPGGEELQSLHVWELFGIASLVGLVVFFVEYE